MKVIHREGVLFMKKFTAILFLLTAFAIPVLAADKENEITTV